MASLTILSETLAQTLQNGRLRYIWLQTLRGAAAINVAAVIRVLLFFSICAVYLLFFG